MSLPRPDLSPIAEEENELGSPMSLSQELKAEDELAVSMSASYFFVPHPLHEGEQLKRDVEMVTGAIAKPGPKTFSAEILTKIFRLFYFGNLECHQQNNWQPWGLPLASAIAHGSRVLMQVPKELDDKLLKWLFEGANERECTRYAASHGIGRISSSDREKALKELKIPVHWEGVRVSRLFLAQMASYVPIVGEAIANLIGPTDCHYGVDLALGGEGELHFNSGNIIQNNGENGHLYLFHSPATEDSPAGWLIGIEQSAPGKADQFGGGHGIFATHHKITASGGTDFAKSEHLKDIGPGRYYDALFLKVDEAILTKAEGTAFSYDMLHATGEPKLNPSRSPLQLELSSASPSSNMNLDEAKNLGLSPLVDNPAAELLQPLAGLMLSADVQIGRSDQFVWSQPSPELQLPVPGLVLEVDALIGQDQQPIQPPSLPELQPAADVVLAVNEQIGQDERHNGPAHLLPPTLPAMMQPSADLVPPLGVQKEPSKHSHHAVQPQSSTWKYVLGAVLLMLSVAALISGIGALAGISTFTILGTLGGGLLTGGGTASAAGATYCLATAQSSTRLAQQKFGHKKDGFQFKSAGVESASSSERSALASVSAFNRNHPSANHPSSGQPAGDHSSNSSNRPMGPSIV